MVFLAFELVKSPLALITSHSPCALKFTLYLCVDPGDVGLGEIEFHLFLMGSILSVFVKNIEGFLTNGNFQIIPVIIPHEVDKSVMLKDVGKLTQQNFQYDIAASSCEQLGDVVDDKMLEY